MKHPLGIRGMQMVYGEERRGCVDYVPLFTPLVVFIDEDSGKGRSLGGLIRGSICGFVHFLDPLGQTYNLGEARVKAEPINLHYLYIPHTSVPPCLHLLPQPHTLLIL